MIRRKKSKITASIIALGISIMTFIVCIVLLVGYIRFAKRTEAALMALHDDIVSVQKDIEEAQSTLEARIEDFDRSVSEGIAAMGKQLEASDSNVTMLSKRAQAQFNETKKMSSTYDALLTEEKSRRIETASLDSSLVLKTREADTLFTNGNYAKAYALYGEILAFQKDNLTVRFRRIFSLFSMNRLDSSVYAEILRECSILRKNGFTDEKLDEMEKFIKEEQGGGRSADQS